jgi:RNA polymerase sigma factor (sigma-70 family)
MNAGQLREVVHGLRQRADQPATADVELLRRYTAGDEAAFELLVWRHAALVLGVCRRVLHHAQDAEDAFQATWLALARRARSVGQRGSVAGWLYQVACRIALRARARAVRRAAQEQPLAGPLADASADPAAQASGQELRQVLDEQLGRLPERFRAVFVLRCLAGLSGPEAARELGCPVGTVESRLARARDRLRTALVQRGFTVPAALIAAWSFDALAERAPAALVAAAVRGAAASITQPAAVSTEAALLAEGVLRTMLLTRFRNIATLVVVVLALAGVGWYGARAGTQTDEPTPQAKEEKATQRLQKLKKTAELEGEWRLEKADVGGKASPDIGWLKSELRWVIRGDSITIQRFGQSTIGTIKVNVSKSPREIDIRLIEGPVPGERVYRGIYKREDVRLTVCYAAPGEPRPTEFATKAGSSAMLAVFRQFEGRGPNVSGESRPSNPPLLFVVPTKSAYDGKLSTNPYLDVFPPATMIINPPFVNPTVMPGGPVQLSPEYMQQFHEYQLLTPSQFKQLQEPPAVLPQVPPPARKRLDGSKDA